MTNPTLFDQTPAARRTDLDTSHLAAASVTGASTIRSRVWQILRSNPDGLTHEQIVEAYRISVDTYGWPKAADQSIRSRTKELERDGMVRCNKTATDKTKSGRLTHRWFAVTDPSEQKRRREAMEQPVSPESTASLVDVMITDIQTSRRLGAFSSREMAQYLVDQGWKRPTT